MVLSFLMLLLNPLGNINFSRGIIKWSTKRTHGSDSSWNDTDSTGRTCQCISCYSRVFSHVCQEIILPREMMLMVMVMMIMVPVMSIVAAKIHPFFFVSIQLILCQYSSLVSQTSTRIMRMSVNLDTMMSLLSLQRRLVLSAVVKDWSPLDDQIMPQNLLSSLLLSSSLPDISRQGNTFFSVHCCSCCWGTKKKNLETDLLCCIPKKKRADESEYIRRTGNVSRKRYDKVLF